MIFLSSPAKTFAKNPLFPKNLEYSVPFFETEADQISRSLQTRTTEQLEKVLDISPKLADLAKNRLISWTSHHSLENSFPALFYYRGEVFTQLSVNKYSKKELNFAKQKLFILSGLYGLLRSLDLIQPYRLEMKLANPVNLAQKLADYWRPQITDFLVKILQDLPSKDRILVNLASQEYSKAIDFDKLPANVYHCQFAQFKNEKYKSIGILNKKARGKMLNYCLQNQISTLKELTSFQDEGYTFDKIEGNEIYFLKNN